MTTRCCHCGQPYLPGNVSNHEARCPCNPDVFARLRQFMQDYADDGVGLPATLYSDLIIGERLPSVTQINRAYGSWRAFVEACGLEHRPYHAVTGPKPELMPGSIMADDEEIWPTSVLRCREVVRVVRAWDWRALAYVPVARMTVWQVR